MKINNNNSDFQNSNWGDDIDTVKFNNKDLDIYGDGNLYGADTIVAGKNARIILSFVNNQLMEGCISFIEDYSNYSLYIIDFKSIKRILKRKYGEPITDTESWYDDTLKDFLDYGSAVALGKLKYNTVWQNGNTEISLLLGGYDGKIRFYINYSIIDYEVIEGIPNVDDSRL